MKYLVLVAPLTLACAKRSGTPREEVGAPPVLSSILPETIRVGGGAVTTIEVRGRGFEPGTPSNFATGKNVLQVGRARFEGIAADSAGTVIRFALPLTYTDTAFKGRPSQFTPGTYDVRVMTSRGTSNAKSLVMIP